MKVIVLGGDGFCGRPTSLELAQVGHEVTIVDNLSRRAIGHELSSGSLTDISSIRVRIEAAREHVGNIEFRSLDVAQDQAGLIALLREVKPDAIVQFAELRAAPYSMLGDTERRNNAENADIA